LLPGCVPWPQEFAERCRQSGYWRGELLGDLLRHWSQTESARTALVTPDSRWSYATLDAKADRLAAGLLELGIEPCDRVVVQLGNIPEFVVLTVALFRIGALPVFALPAHRRNEISYLCECSKAVAYVISDIKQGFDYRLLAADVLAHVSTLKHVLVVGEPGEFIALRNIEAAPKHFPAPSPSEVAFFLLSGGTTSSPKLIPRTHDDYAYQLRTTAQALSFDENGVYLAALPIGHNAALGCPGVLGTLLVGGKVVLAPTPSPDDIFPLIEQEGVTLTTLMPSLLNLWLDTAGFFNVDLSKVLLQVGGAKLNPETARQVRPKLGCALTHWFGMAEGLLSYTRLDDTEDVIVHTQGRPLSPGDEILVVDELDREVAPGKIGQLLTRGPYTLRGYYNAEKYNETAFTSDGYLRTGDMVRITPEGNMIVEGRLKDVINRGGEKVSAEEIEGHLLLHPDVKQVAVIAMPDSAMGEKTCAVIVPRRNTIKLQELQEFLIACGLADYKLPDRVKLVESLPHTNLGKINKVALRRAVHDELAGTQ
jgi:2,3-dihydroxybenzoate-AMP ligase